MTGEKVCLVRGTNRIKESIVHYNGQVSQAS